MYLLFPIRATCRAHVLHSTRWNIEILRKGDTPRPTMVRPLTVSSVSARSSQRIQFVSVIRPVTARSYRKCKFTCL
jgi:hypothetical protein